MGLFQAKSKRIIEELNTQNVEQFTTLLNNQILDAIKRNHEELVDHLVEQAHSKMRFYGTTFVMRPDVLQKYNQFKQQILDRERRKQEQYNTEKAKYLSFCRYLRLLNSEGKTNQAEKSNYSDEAYRRYLSEHSTFLDDLVDVSVSMEKSLKEIASTYLEILYTLANEYYQMAKRGIARALKNGGYEIIHGKKRIQVYETASLCPRDPGYSSTYPYLKNVFNFVGSKNTPNSQICSWPGRIIVINHREIFEILYERLVDLCRADGIEVDYKGYFFSTTDGPNDYNTFDLPYTQDSDTNAFQRDAMIAFVFTCFLPTEYSTERKNAEIEYREAEGVVRLEAETSDSGLSSVLQAFENDDSGNDNCFDRFDDISGYAFEHYCAELLAQNGYTDITVTSGSGDQGIDIIAYKHKIKYGIQCKCYSSDIGNAAVQEANAGKAFYNCNVGVVLTNRYFTKSAIALAEKTGIVLWDRDQLIELISTAQNKQI